MKRKKYYIVLEGKLDKYKPTPPCGGRVFRSPDIRVPVRVYNTIMKRVEWKKWEYNPQRDFVETERLKNCSISNVIMISYKHLLAFHLIKESDKFYVRFKQSAKIQVSEGFYYFLFNARFRIFHIIDIEPQEYQEEPWS